MRQTSESESADFVISHPNPNPKIRKNHIRPISNSERCFSYCAPRLYNALPQDVRAAPNVEIFKKRLKTEFFIKAYNMETLSLKPEFYV